MTPGYAVPSSSTLPSGNEIVLPLGARSIFALAMIVGVGLFLLRVADEEEKVIRERKVNRHE